MREGWRGREGREDARGVREWKKSDRGGEGTDIQTEGKIQRGRRDTEREGEKSGGYSSILPTFLMFCVLIQYIKTSLDASAKPLLYEGLHSLRRRI